MCTERYINPFTDFGFKRLFGSEVNKEFLINFLNSLFVDEDPIADINYRNVEHLGLLPTDRNAVFDLYCTTKSGNHIIVEMQNGYQKYYVDRSIFYATFPIQEMAKRGEWDFNLPKVYTVAFLNFTMSQFAGNPAFKHVARLTDVDTKQEFSDKLTFVYIEMPKFNKELDDINSDFETWIYIIKNINQLDELPPRIKKRIFKRFFDAAEIQAFSNSERAAYEESLKHLRDYYNTINTAKEISKAEGIAEGFEKGRLEGELDKAREIARALLASATMSPQQIARITNLDISEIDKL